MSDNPIDHFQIPEKSNYSQFEEACWALNSLLQPMDETLIDPQILEMVRVIMDGPIPNGSIITVSYASLAELYSKAALSVSDRKRAEKHWRTSDLALNALEQDELIQVTVVLEHIDLEGLYDLHEKIAGLTIKYKGFIVPEEEYSAEQQAEARIHESGQFDFLPYEYRKVLYVKFQR